MLFKKIVLQIFGARKMDKIEDTMQLSEIINPTSCAKKKKKNNFSHLVEVRSGD
jgi:16S rRNA C1402 N4-methylase RsmH